MIAKHTKKLLAVAGLVLSASTVLAQASPVTNSVQPELVGVQVPQPFTADRVGEQSRTRRAMAFDTVSKMLSPPKNSDEKVTLVEGLDLQPWTKVASREKGKPLYPTPETHELKLHWSWAF